jgi:hypothetical protein
LSLREDGFADGNALGRAFLLEEFDQALKTQGQPLQLVAEFIGSRSEFDLIPRRIIVPKEFKAQRAAQLRWVLITRDKGLDYFDNAEPVLNSKSAFELGATAELVPLRCAPLRPEIAWRKNGDENSGTGYVFCRASPQEAQSRPFWDLARCEGVRREAELTDVRVLDAVLRPSASSE